MKHPSRFAPALLCLSVLVASILPPVHAQPDERGAIELREGVVVDLERGAVYLRNLQGTLEARALRSGELVWRSEIRAKPLVASDATLIAHRESDERGRFELVTLDASNGSLLREADIPVPREVDATLQDTARSSFRARASASRDGSLDVAWRQSSRGRNADRGYVPAPTEGKGPGFDSELGELVTDQVLEGSASLDLGTGDVRRTRAVRSTREAPALRSYDGLNQVAGRKFLSRDGRHVLASVHEGGSASAPYSWSIYTRGGELLGATRSDVSATPFLVSGTTLLAEVRPGGSMVDGELSVEPLRLRAVDLSTSMVAWTASVAQTEFTGPFAP